MRLRVEEEEEAEVQMAPLIDCVFLLLIFFLVGATLKKALKEVDIDLPVSQAAVKAKSAHETLVVEVTKDGHVYLDGHQASTRDLHKKLRRAAVERPGRSVRIDGDRRCPLLFLARLVDMCQFEGLNDIRIRAKD